MEPGEHPVECVCRGNGRAWLCDGKSIFPPTPVDPNPSLASIVSLKNAGNQSYLVRQLLCNYVKNLLIEADWTVSADELLGIKTGDYTATQGERTLLLWSSEDEFSVIERTRKLPPETNKFHGWTMKDNNAFYRKHGTSQPCSLMNWAGTLIHFIKHGAIPN